MKIHFFPSTLLVAVGVALLGPRQAAADTVNIFAARETSLFEQEPDANLGISDLAAGTTAGGKKSRGLWEFDIAASIPAGSLIQSVLFQVGVVRQALNAQTSAYALHHFLKDWTEGTGGPANTIPALAGETSWNNQFHGTTSWSVPGGQAGDEYLATASATGPVIGSAGITYTIASTPALVGDVQGWLDNPASNNGWFFLATDESTSATARRFSSTEAPGLGLSPQITVNYTVPEPGTTLSLLGGAALLLQMRLRRNRCT